MANITLEAVEAVMAQAKAEFPAAKEALMNADGNVEEAVRALTGDNSEEPVADGEYTPQNCVEQAQTAETEEQETVSGEAEKDTFREEGEEQSKLPVDEIIEKLKKLVKSGNVDRIVVSRGDDVLLNIPVNVGLVGSVIGLAAAPWAVIAAAIAAFGFSCKTEIIKKDGTKEEV